MSDDKDARIAELQAALKTVEAARDEWRSDFRQLEKAVVGETGLSAMTVALQAKLWRPRTETAEAENARLRDALKPALEACGIIDAAVKEGHSGLSELLNHLLAAAKPARAALEAKP